MANPSRRSYWIVAATAIAAFVAVLVSVILDPEDTASETPQPEVKQCIEPAAPQPAASQNFGQIVSS